MLPKTDDGLSVDDVPAVEAEALTAEQRAAVARGLDAAIEYLFVAVRGLIAARRLFRDGAP